jgi:NAD(P)-dependent dehydrogenase (short-subunit alcohol dehydrogenase family)
METRLDLNEVFSVRGKTAIVTGGASGLGLAFGEVLATNGAEVVLLDLNGAAAQREAQRLVDCGHNVRGAALDVTNRDALDAAFDGVAQKSGRLDIVFANAGIDPGPGFLSPTDRAVRVPEHQIEQYEDARWHKVIAVALDAVFYSIRAASRHMKPAGSGSIIVTTSISAVRPAPTVGMAYMAAKAAAAHLTRTAALELARYGVRVNAVAPGPFATNIAGSRPDSSAFFDALAKSVPLGRVASPNEIKPLALLLASNAGSFITGEQIVIDGGTSLGSVN